MYPRSRFDQANRNPNQHSINNQIRAYRVRVIQDGNPLGIMPTNQARQIAQEEGLDLVLIAPQADPPVCHIMDYGKFKYEDSLKKKAQRKKTKAMEEKEIRLSPGIGEHDVEFKLTQAREFLDEGRRVQFVVKYTGRENAHKDIGFRLIEGIIDKLADVASVESKPRFEGKRLFCRLEPKKKD